MKTKRMLTFCFAGILMSCSKFPVTSTLKSETYRDMHQETPHSILVMLPINKTGHADAQGFFYTSLITALSGRGYYVMPPFMSQEILRRESANDAEHFSGSPLQTFGADAVLFTTIYNWRKGVFKIQAEVEYVLRSTKTNKVLFQRKGDFTYDTSVEPGSKSGVLEGIAGAVVNSAINTALTSELKVARLSNLASLSDLPAGRYHANHMIDSAYVAGLKVFSKTLGGSDDFNSVLVDDMMDLALSNIPD